MGLTLYAVILSGNNKQLNISNKSFEKANNPLQILNLFNINFPKFCTPERMRKINKKFSTWVNDLTDFIIFSTWVNDWTDFIIFSTWVNDLTDFIKFCQQ